MASTSIAGGLDRSGLSVSALFKDPGTLNLSFGSVTPSITGTDIGGPSGDYDVGDSYTQLGASYTHAINDDLTVALIFDQPYGVNTSYEGDPTTSYFAETEASLSSNAISVLGKYQLNENFSLFGGLRAQRVSGDISLNGLVYTGAIGSDYRVTLDSSMGFGYAVGAAYEIPDIALRAVLTYHSAIEHEADTVEYFGGTVIAPSAATVYESPKSINLDLQTGIAQNTLLTAGVRWAEWGSVDVIPALLGSDLVSLSDTTTYKLGLARRFNESWAGSISFTYEEEGDPLVSPLGPTNGLFGITLGAQYAMDNMTISGGINYSILGDAQASAAGVGYADFEDNTALGLGFSVDFQI